MKAVFWELKEIRLKLPFNLSRIMTGENRRSLILEEKIILYREQYENLPARFKNKIDRDLEYLLDAHIPGLKKIYLFGSCARGDVRSTSDVDLLIVTEEKLTDRMLAAAVRWTLDEDLEGVRTDIVYSHEEADAPSPGFQKALDRDKKLIAEVKK